MRSRLDGMTRREFCTAVAGTAVEGIANLSTNAVCESVQEKKLQIGIAGTCGVDGDIILFWPDSEKKHGRMVDIEIICIYDKNQKLCRAVTKTVNKLYGTACQGYVSFQEMMKTESRKLDAVFIFSPIEDHEQQVTECLTHKIPVFCVAPLAQDLKTVRRLFDLAHKTNTLLACGRLVWGGVEKQYRFCREKLCGAGGLLGECVRLSAESYIRNFRVSDLPQDSLPNPPFVADHDPGIRQKACAFWNMTGIRTLLNQCWKIHWFYPFCPLSVSGFQSSFGKFLSTADLAVFRYETRGRTVLADFALHNTYYAFDKNIVSYRGDFGALCLASNLRPEEMLIEMEICAGTDDSNHKAMDKECRRRWYPAIRNPKGILGQCVDIAFRHLDYRSYIWRCETGGELDEEAFKKLEEESTGFEGKRNLWQFPKEVLNEDAKEGGKNYAISDFLDMVRTGKKDLESVKEVFRAQVMVCGIAESVRTGKPFHFTPEMFEL